METFRCCKCGAINQAQKVNGAAGKNGEIATSENETEEKVLMFDTRDQAEFIKIYEDGNDTGKWD